MNFDAFNGKRRTRRQSPGSFAPALVESLEIRALLTPGPAILSPSAVVSVSQPTVSWEAVPNAVRYDLWISDVEARERIVYKEGIIGTTTNLNSAERLSLGVNRIWVRAVVMNPQTNALSRTDWGLPKDVLLQARPTVTGPTSVGNGGLPNQIDGNDWAITWTSPAGAESFEVFLSNQTTLTSTTYVVANGTPATEADGEVNEDFIRNPAIEITSAAHGLINGQQIRISGVVGISEANGDFSVTVTSVNTFRLTGVIGNGSYTAGGTWVRIVNGVAQGQSTSKTITNVVVTNSGYQIEQEVRSLHLDGAVPVIGSAPQTVSSVLNRSYVDVTSENHGLATGSRVRISGVLGNTAANGDFTVTALSANVFRLNGVTGNGTYTSGGSWIRLNGNVPATGATARLLTRVSNSSAVDVIVMNHGLQTGDQVRITGVQGNTAANGTFFVTVISPNAIRLNGVTGITAFTQGGQLVRLTRFSSTLEMGKYRVFVRSRDDAGRYSAWSTAYDFEITPIVNVQRPLGTTFDDQQPLLQWEAVPGATHYQVEVFQTGVPAPLYRQDFVTTNSFRFPDPIPEGTDASYQFRVRARKLHQVQTVSLRGNPTTGSYRIRLTSIGREPVTGLTPALPYNATAEQIQTAINSLPGFGSLSVVSQTSGPDVTHLIQIPLTGNGAFPAAFSGNHVIVELVESSPVGRVVNITSPGHGLFNGARVRISGLSSVSQANGDFTVTVVNANVFRLNGVYVNTTSSAPPAASGQWVRLLGSNPQPNTAPRNITAVALPNSIETTRRLSSLVGLWSPFATFSTLTKPTITGPVGIDNADPTQPVTVTDLQPTITWTPIDSAARYEIRVDRQASTEVYLNTSSPRNSYRFEISILPGNYTVRVRAVSRTGEFSEWSNSYSFVATGGATVVSDPVTILSGRRARIQWAAVAEAASYEMQIAWIGVNFDFIHPTDLVTTDFVTSSLTAGNYRVWVRAIMADGTTLPWSTPVDFTVVDSDIRLQDSDGPQLALLSPSLRVEQTETRTETRTENSDEQESAEVAVVPEADLIQQLAESCSRQEWWTSSEQTSG